MIVIHFHAPLSMSTPKYIIHGEILLGHTHRLDQFDDVVCKGSHGSRNCHMQDVNSFEAELSNLHKPKTLGSRDCNRTYSKTPRHVLYLH